VRDRRAASSAYMHAEIVEVPVERPQERFTKLLSHLPLIVYAVLYVITCYVGVLALLLSPTFRTIYLAFSGADVPPLDVDAAVRVLLLLHAGPLCLWLGYRVARRLTARVRAGSSSPLHTNVWGPRAVFALSVVIGCISFTRADAWAAFDSWVDYNAYIHARLNLFDQLTFFEFVNFYALLPVTAAYLCLTERRRLVAAFAVATTLGLQAGLAQRRILLLTAILIAAAMYLYRFAGSHPRTVASRTTHARLAALTALVLYTLYAALTLTTVIRSQSKPFDEVQRIARTPRRHSAREWLRFTPDPDAAARLEHVRWRAISLYVLLSPLTRTSISAIAYPGIFPDILPFYSLDLGQDILGFGAMPNDNLKVYSVLWPEHKEGAIAAPAQFVFYSQGGMIVACLGMVLAGALLALLWTLAVLRDTMLPDHALIGAVIIVLAMSLTMDSARNAFLVSYGAVWEFASIAVLALTARCGALVSLASAGIHERSVGVR